MAANESMPGSSRMIMGGQLGSFHSQIFYPAGPLLSPDRTLAPGSMTALHFAAMCRRLDALRWCVAHRVGGPDCLGPNAVGFTPLHFACFLRRSELVPYDVDGQSTECAQYLLSCGADVNAECRSGATALELATERYYEKLVSLLIATPETSEAVIRRAIDTARIGGKCNLALSMEQEVRGWRA